MLCLKVGPEGPHRNPLSALLAAHLAPTALLAVQVPHLRLVGVRGEAGANASGQEDHHLCLCGVGLEAHAVKVGAQGVEDPLDDGGVACHNEDVVGVEDREEAADV